MVTVKEGSLRSVGHNTVKKEPVTPEILRNLIALYGKPNSNLKDIRLACMCLLSYSGFLRYSEVSNLKRHQVVIYDSYIRLFLETSKTDVYREGRAVVISRTNNSTCPVNMLLRYLSLADIQSNSTDFIFRPLCFCKTSGSYKLRSGKLSYTTAREILLSALEKLGLNKKLFGLHSLRSGGATAAATAHVEDRLLKKHGRWKTTVLKMDILNKIFRNVCQSLKM